jgi:two-component system CheB/CheR fusion protein
LLFREFLIGVTRFFRDPSMFESLTATVIRTLVADHSVSGIPIRIWVAGCAAGEEAYSLAILFSEEMLRAESRVTATIFATDIDERSITFARGSLYRRNRIGCVWRARDGARYCVSKHIRDMCVFSVHHLVKDPPFSKLDLVSCRNLLVYFGARLQRRVIATFHYALRRRGILWFGPSEAVVRSERCRTRQSC